jgi:LysM repeat protein
VAGAALVAVATAAAPGWSPYVIKSGDTLWGLAKAHHTTVAELQRENGLTGSTIYAGRTLLIPGNGAPATAALPPAPPTTKTYVVKAGDTLTKIAKTQQTTVDALASKNHLTGTLRIYIGQVLTLPIDVSTTPGVFAAPAKNPTYAAAIAQSAQILATRPNPSRSAIADLVRAEAARQGVPASLALAVATQESGFSQRMVSSTNAVGVMQLMPSTADWLASYAKQPLDRYDVNANIRGGITLLRILLQNASPADSVAGYYQGLASVRSHGMYTDTKAYVANVLALQKRLS